MRDTPVAQPLKKQRTRLQVLARRHDVHDPGRHTTDLQSVRERRRARASDKVDLCGPVFAGREPVGDGFHTVVRRSGERVDRVDVESNVGAGAGFQCARERLALAVSAESDSE